VLDWSLGDLNHQVGWSRRAVEAALEQACRYAAEQKVRCVAVSDGAMLYAADVVRGGLRDRVFVPLDEPEPQEALWWLSVHGIYRDRANAADAALRLLPESTAAATPAADETSEQLLHPKYGLPAWCFAYVGDAGDPHSWHLPYLCADGTVDARRLPKAIQAILSNYRGARVSSVPEVAIPAVLVRLARAAGSQSKLPEQTAEPAPAYVQLTAALEQFGRLAHVSEAEIGAPLA
jgi:hypothetical protein